MSKGYVKPILPPQQSIPTPQLKDSSIIDKIQIQIKVQTQQLQQQPQKLQLQQPQSQLGYQSRKKVPVSINTNEPLEFIALDWYECDLYSDHDIERKNSFLNQEHNKSSLLHINLKVLISYYSRTRCITITSRTLDVTYHLQN